jgi:serine/threonine protein kinase
VVLLYILTWNVGFVGVTCDGSFVTDLSLSSLSLDATIPTEIGSLTTLLEIDFSHNSLYGTMPTELGLLTSLLTLDLSNNVITGTMPASFEDLTSIVDMNLYSNQIGGTLPAFVGSLSTLDKLYLQSNSFVYRVPSAICELTNTTIRLDGNNFACYDSCGDINTTNIRYGSTQLCSPTHAPTHAPQSDPIETPTVQAIVVVMAFLGLVVFVGLAWFLWRRRQRNLIYKEFPVHKVILDGDTLTEKMVLAHADSARGTVKGKTALQLVLDKLSGDFNIHESALFALVDTSLHFNTETGELIEDEALHNFAWGQLVQNDHDIVLAVVERVLAEYDNHAELLADSLDRLGRKCADIASPRCREAINQSVMLFRKFELKHGPPEHVSATSLVRFATMHTKDDEFNNVKTAVALKFMKHRSQFVTEITARQAADFSSEYVIMILESYDGESTNEDDQAFRFSAIKKGFENYPFCVVMDVAENCLQRVILQQHVAGYDWDTIKLITKSLCGCLSHLHSRNVVHGDLKPLNVVMVNNTVRLIDFDAACRFSDGDDCEYAGSKYSSAYLPPELFFEKSPGKIVVKTYVKDSETGQPSGVRQRLKASGGVIYDHPAGYALERASPAQDMWALGAILYLLCTGVTLFQASVEDNIPQSELAEVYNWTEATKEEHLSSIKDKYARNLLSLLLSPEPSKRISPERVLAHPFISGKSPERLIGEEAKYDVFLSYRVDSDLDHVLLIYNALRNLELKVWLDKYCLLPGQPWEDGFCDGLINSSCFVCLISRGAINHPTKTWQNFSNMEAGSRVDNVLLEWRLALELRDRYLIEGIFPIFIGDAAVNEAGIQYSDYFRSGCHPKPLPDCAIASVEAKLKEHLNRQGQGLPLEDNRSVKDIVESITGNQGGFLRGEPNQSLEVICQAIVQMRKQIQFKKFEEQNAVASGRSNVASVRGMSVEERNDFLLEENERLRVENAQIASLRAEIDLMRHQHEKFDVAEREIERLQRELDKATHKEHSTSTAGSRRGLTRYTSTTSRFGKVDIDTSTRNPDISVRHVGDASIRGGAIGNVIRSTRAGIRSSPSPLTAVMELEKADELRTESVKSLAFSPDADMQLRRPSKPQTSPGQYTQASPPAPAVTNRQFTPMLTLPSGSNPANFNSSFRNSNINGSARSYTPSNGDENELVGLRSQSIDNDV